jgi:quinol monooxygenase YgiN
MSVTRINQFRSLDGQGDTLRRILRSFVATIESSPGCRSCRVLRHMDDPRRTVVVEVWDNVASHEASLKSMPPGALDQAMKMLSGPPSGDYFLAVD